MNNLDRRLLNISNVLVGGTGVVYGVMKYLMESTDEWAVVNHPWQPHMQHLHILAAPLLVFVGGLFATNHVIEKIRGNKKRGRLSGIILGLQFVPMVFSGYLIQVSVSESWRSTWIWVHIVTAALWIIMAVTHRIGIPPRMDQPTDPSE